MSTFAAGYDYGAMTSYARSWAYGRNPIFRQFGNDCQNFVSQSLHAGGWVEQPGWYLSDAGWWYSGPNQSRPWVNAQRDIRVSYHTNDTLNRSIWNLHSSFPYAAWYALRT
ncbi:amidase domain-containing protein [Paenarthrobacter sp. NPDC056912]|uniref:amidase domain-containing protein n=1 Tax=Paenarthrobacter sp. NPDC056912 TaxID=3345965 RepID=UPI0036714B79